MHPPPEVAFFVDKCTKWLLNWFILFIVGFGVLGLLGNYSGGIYAAATVRMRTCLCGALRQHLVVEYACPSSGPTCCNQTRSGTARDYKLDIILTSNIANCAYNEWALAL